MPTRSSQTSLLFERMAKQAWDLHGDGEREEEADEDELPRPVAEDRRAREQQVAQHEQAPVPAGSTRSADVRSGGFPEQVNVQRVRDRSHIDLPQGSCGIGCCDCKSTCKTKRETPKQSIAMLNAKQAMGNAECEQQQCITHKPINLEVKSESPFWIKFCESE